MTKPTNPPKMKPAKAWALIDEETGYLMENADDRPGDCIYRRKTMAQFAREDGERIARVLITEVPR